MKFELGSINVDGEMKPALDIPGVGIVLFHEDETGGYVELNREQQLALKKELD